MLEVQIRIKSTVLQNIYYKEKPSKFPAVAKTKLKINFPTIAIKINCKSKSKFQIEHKK